MPDVVPPCPTFPLASSAESGLVSKAVRAASAVGPDVRAAARGVCACLAVTSLLAAGSTPGLAQSPGRPHEGLSRLVPLLDLYASGRGAAPSYDVAGIRCAALFTAQRDWVEPRGGDGRPTLAQLDDIALHVTRSEYVRRQGGMAPDQAATSVRVDMVRVAGLYTARFRQREGIDVPPWMGDTLIRDDTAYCEILNGRR
jgi:hypothetical protein